jgi:hypothetical protein
LFKVSRQESNDPGSTVPDNAHGLGNPEPTTSSIDPSEEGTTQPETGQVSIETQAPNPLSTLIHIYSDDESLEPAHDTPVRVQEEKGPEKTTSPEPEVQDKQALQMEIGSEGGLDTRESDRQEAEARPSGETPQKKIDSSTADEQVSNESVPDASITPNIQVPDEQQVEARSTKQSEEIREPTPEKIYTMGSLRNNLSWGDQQIPEPVDEVADIYAISYDQKRKAIIQRTAKR